MLLYSHFKTPTKKRILVAITIVFLSAFSGYQHIIQLDMVKSFFNQGWFWSRITQFCPNLEEDTVIIIEKEALSETKYIYTYSWADPYILDLLYRFPGEWDQPPTVLTVRSGWESDLVFEDGKWVYHWNDYFSSALVDGKIIKIKYDPVINNFVTIDQPILTPDGSQIQTQTPGFEGVCPFETTPVFDILIDPQKMESDPIG
jgi:hypothetical protein